MTDILTKLAALTAIDKNGLLPCAICGHPNEVDGIKPSIESNRRRVVCTHCGMTTIWCDSAGHAIQTANNRPREAALIALVQEAAAEIERLSKRESGWQSIETAPRDSTPVMIWLEDEGFAVKALWRNVPADLKEDDEAPDLKMWWLPEMDVYTKDAGMQRITHWQPCLEGPSLNPQEAAP
jgi:hypothetical protein